MANNPPNIGDSNNPILPDIDWSAILVPVTTAPIATATEPVETASLITEPVETASLTTEPVEAELIETQIETTESSSAPVVPLIDWSSIVIPGSSSRQSSQALSPLPAPTQAVPSIDWASVEVPTDISRDTRPFFDIRNDQDRFPSLDEFMTMLTLDPAVLERITPHIPGLRESLDAESPERRVTILTQVYNMIQMLNADHRGDNPSSGGPDIMDPGIQERIEQEIQQKNVQESRELAIEHAPEMFGRVEMLYIHCRVNSMPIVAFIDSGAQMSILSRRIAEECGMMRLLDGSFSGIARGVGTAPILGRIHLAQLEIENQFLPCSFSVMEQTADLILGLDMLKRHQCIIDLNKGMLVLTSAKVEAPFISESQIPEQERIFSQGEDVVKEQTAMEESSLGTQMQEDRNLAEAMEQSDAPDPAS